MATEKIVRTNVYLNPKYVKAGDNVITTYYENENDMTVSDLLFAMEGFIVHSDIIRSKHEKLFNCLERMDYVGYYKLIKKMASKAIKDLE